MLTRAQYRKLRLWWVANGMTVLGLTVWAALLLEVASVFSVPSGDLFRPYRVEFVEGGLSIMAAASERGCLAEASIGITCIQPETSRSDSER